MKIKDAKVGSYFVILGNGPQTGPYVCLVSLAEDDAVVRVEEDELLEAEIPDIGVVQIEPPFNLYINPTREVDPDTVSDEAPESVEERCKRWRTPLQADGPET